MASLLLAYLITKTEKFPIKLKFFVLDAVCLFINLLLVITFFKTLSSLFFAVGGLLIPGFSSMSTVSLLCTLVVKVISG